MNRSVAAVHAVVSTLKPVDALEAEHIGRTLGWLERTDDVFRRVKPAQPPMHLVSYVVPVDEDGAMLLVAHINAGLWLPPGGHVEPGEHPVRTAERELAEELGLKAREPEPIFLTVTETVGIDAGHTDVSIWFVHPTTRENAINPDLSEFTQTRWWTPAELDAAEPAEFDPHLFRFIKKIALGTAKSSR
jgi:8-oxo-dGTP pyrophosphatase MutT (NUDIX family)